MIRVHSLETFGTHEGPGIRFVVFLQGCHFRCLYCHNPDTWNLQGGTEYSIDDIVKKAVDEIPYYGKRGGITVSGGEPLLQREALYTLFKKAHEAGIHTTLDTNGSILDEKTEKLLEETDLVLLDIKHIDDSLHKKLTGASNYVPLQFAKYLEVIGKPFWLRYVFVPGYTDQKKHIKKLAQTFASFRHLKRLEILPYHVYGAYKYKELGIPYPLKGVEPPSTEHIEEAKKIFSHYIPDVRVR